MLRRNKRRPGAYQRPRPWALLPLSIIPHIRIVVTGVGWLAGKHSKANVSLWFGKHRDLQVDYPDLSLKYINYTAASSSRAEN